MKRISYVFLISILILSIVMPTHIAAASQTNVAPLLKEIDTGSYNTIILTEDGVPLVWGFMNGTKTTSGSTIIPSIIEGLNDITDIDYLVALKKDGTVWDRRNPDLSVNVTDVTQIGGSPSANHIYALKKDGTVLEWGQYNSDKLSPRSIPGLDQVKSIQLGSYAIKEDGTVWDLNYDYGYKYSTASPYKNLLNVKKMAASGNMLLKEDGTVWSYNYLSKNYEEIEGLPKIKDIEGAPNQDAFFALSEDGNLYGWGDNRTGILGDGTANKTLKPKLIISNVRLLSNGSGNHIMVQKKDLSLWAWGRNDYGELGVELLNKKKNSPLPIQVHFEWPKQHVWDQVVGLNMNGKSLFFVTKKPYITVKQEVMIPALSFAQQLNWAASLSNGVLKISSNSNTLTVTKSSMNSGNGNTLSSKTSPRFVNGEVFVPLRTLSEAFDLTYKYNFSIKTVGIFNSSFKEWNKLDNYGRLKRTSGLPNNVTQYPYILADMPNAVYEKAFPKSINSKYMSLNATQLFNTEKEGYPFDLLGEDFGRYADHITKYYQLLLNADYRNINLNWAASLASHVGGSSMDGGQNKDRLLKMESYVKWIKKNKVIIQGNVRPEPSMISYRDGVLYMRTYFQYEIVQADASDYLKLRKDHAVQLITAPTGKSVIGKYAMYVDVPLVAGGLGNLRSPSMWFDWASGLKVYTFEDIMPTPWEGMFTQIMIPG